MDYLSRKINNKKFKEYFDCLIGELKGKKVLIYGAGKAFFELFKAFDIKQLNIVAVSDLKFTQESEFEGFKAIPPAKIMDYDYDVILMTLIYPVKAVDYLQFDLGNKKDIKLVFEEITPKDNEFLQYLDKIKFQKHLDKISKKLKGKKVLIYGAGVFFQTISEYYDLSKGNIIGISDMKFEVDNNVKEFLGYKTFIPSKMKDLDVDYVLISIQFFVNIIDNLEKEYFKGTKIKVRPLIRKPFKELWHEIWC